MDKIKFEVRKYFSEIGRLGGKKSRRILTAEQARLMGIKSANSRRESRLKQAGIANKPSALP